ncbi:formate dehydrogenase accessory sulfurtransferase FdhD [bacterium]|nr:formate dehydrogenase accessory sulfurtransferase FdhD [bacterium]MBU1636601.1 formate dehydrogenase accessory sulfurtransferase FdhD [bacterium]MBU1921014.1 formate dehydrogenase accessory sulfurtransferase FdhD [bacterium]
MIALEQKIWKWKAASGDMPASTEEVQDWIARETTLTVVVNGSELVSFSSSPDHCQDLALGFLFTEGVITSRGDIARLHHDVSADRVEVDLAEGIDFKPAEWNRTRTLTSGCGQGVQLNAPPKPRRVIKDEEPLCVDATYFRRLFSNLRAFSVWYERTGCIHQSTLVPIPGAPIIREDIGRHNAVDKAIGAGLAAGVNFGHSLLSTTGRLSSDMTSKAARAGIPMIVSRSAPTSLAVAIAEDAGMTLIGFVRGPRINIYTHPHRINLNPPDMDEPED